MKQSVSSNTLSREDVIALFARGREIKERRMRGHNQVITTLNGYKKHERVGYR